MEEKFRKKNRRASNTSIFLQYSLLLLTLGSLSVCGLCSLMMIMVICDVTMVAELQVGGAYSTDNVIGMVVHCASSKKEVHLQSSMFSLSGHNIDDVPMYVSKFYILTFLYTIYDPHMFCE